MFYLSHYSPELNPEERLNAVLKQAGKKVSVRTKAKLHEATNEQMSQLAVVKSAVGWRLIRLCISLTDKAL